MNASELAERLGGRRSGKNWACKCPAHDDRKASLSISDGRDHVVLNCHTGCTFDEIIAAIGIPASELRSDKPNGKPVIAALYDYRRIDGRLAYQVVRFDPKDFRQRRPDGDGWSWSMQGIERVLYRWPELSRADPEEPVFLVEGEKDADNLIAIDLTATTIAGGAKAPWHERYTQALIDRNVVILPDNDEPGRHFAERCAKQLHGHAARVRVVHLPVPERGDVTDYLSRFDRASLLELVAQCPEWHPGVKSEAPPQRLPESVTLSDLSEREVEWLWPARIPLGKLTLFDGNPGLGKSCVTCDWITRVTNGRSFYGTDHAVERGSCLILGDEDDPQDTILPRLRAAGADTSLVDVVPVPSDVKSIDAHIRWRMMTGHPLRLIIIDPIGLFLNLVDANDPRTVRLALKELAALAQKYRLAMVLVRHLNKKDGPALYRGSGSIVIVGLARSAMVVGEDPDDKSVRVLSMVKFNLAKDPGSLRYVLRESPVNQRPVVEWMGASGHTADEVTAVAHNGTRRTGQMAARGNQPDMKLRMEAIEWLSRRLERVAGSDLRSSVLLDGQRAGFSESTIERARRSLPIETEREPSLKGRMAKVRWVLTTQND